LSGASGKNGANIGGVRRLALRRSVLLGLLTLASFACARKASEQARPFEDKLVVFAATSLREAFTALGAEFERAHSGVKLTFNFAGTQELRTQLEHGAPCDVFASADQRHMRELVKASRVAEPLVFARNEPVIVVAKESASILRQFADLPQARRLVIGAPEVPIGRYTGELLERANGQFGPDFRARVETNVVSRELNVKQVLAKVSLGEAQAGIVYRTDARAAGDRVSLVVIPPYVNIVAEYPIAIVARPAHPLVARAWVDFVLAPAGQDVLLKAGFLPPMKSFKKP
jgi:molybdate transport system substrate-binding protein